MKITPDQPGRICYSPERPAVRFAAEQLAYYVGMLTGAHPLVQAQDLSVRSGCEELQNGCKKVHDGAGGPEVHLRVETGPRECGRGAGAGEDRCVRDECLLEVAAGRATLHATSDFALLHGVYRLLERFGGVVWLNRLEADEYLPRRPALELPEGRYWWRARFEAMAFTNYPDIGPETADFVDWMAKAGYRTFMVNAAVEGAWETFRDHLLQEVRLRGMEVSLGHHSFAFWVPPGELFGHRPDYFAMVGGRRLPDGQLCTSNPELRRAVVERIVEFLRENPDVHEVAVWPRDGGGWCECEKCLAEEPQAPSWWDRRLPRRTDTYLKFVNAVAEMVGEAVGGVRVAALAYMNYVEPPRQVVPAENVVVYFAPMKRCFKHRLGHRGCHRRNGDYGEMLRRWRDVTPGGLRVFEYFMQVDTLSLPYRRTGVLPEDFDYLERAGVEGLVVEYDPREWAAFSANAYLMGRLGWECDAGDVAAGEQYLREHIYPALYGPAARDVAEFWEELAERMVYEGPCTGHYDLTWAARATAGYLQPALAALGRARALAAADRAAWRALERVAVAAELLLRVGRWQRAMADLAEASGFTRPRRLELARQAAADVVRWAQRWADAGVLNAEKIARRVQSEMAAAGG